MKRLFSLLILLAALTPMLHATDPILQQLDTTIANRQHYIDRKEALLHNLKEVLANTSDEAAYPICKQIYLSYNGLNTDSAVVYSRRCEELAAREGNAAHLQEARIFQAQCYSINCLFERARAILEPISGHICPGNEELYYKACCSVCIWESEFSTVPEVQEADRQKIQAYRRIIIGVETDSIWKAQEEALLLAYDGADLALEHILPVFRSLPPNDDRIRYLSNSVGSFYSVLDMPDSALHYFAVSAISDLEHGIMEHASLREVALILFRQGDVERAYRYMNCCIIDADLCKARLRTIEMAGDMPVILDAYQHMIHSQQHRLRLTVISLIIAVALLIVIVILAFISRRRLAIIKEKADKASEQLRLANQQLRESLQQLEESNRSLQESNRIRSAYVTQYMKECSDAIGKLGIYHQQLLRIAMQSNYEKLLSAIKSTDFIDDNLRLFYQNFDETFLSLFPHFVDDLNGLLREEERFPLPQVERLSTELRIFALIRLGINDSDDIARFLRLSTKTVYNYRASVRNRAAGNRDQLEQQIMQTSVSV